MTKYSLSYLLLLLIISCSNTKSIGFVYQQNFDFSSVKNYSLYNRNSLFSDTQNLLDTRRNAIEIAIERSMSKQNFNYIEPEKADLIIAYHLLNGNRSEYSKYNEIVRFCTNCLRSSTWNIENKYSSIEQGSLVIDVVDTKQNRSVWRSIHPLKLKVQDNSAESNLRINSAIQSMLAKLPSHQVN